MDGKNVFSEGISGEVLLDRITDNEKVIKIIKTFGPSAPKKFEKGASAPLLYVNQGESAYGVTKDSKFEWVGSGDIATGVVVIIRNRTTKAQIGLAHVTDVQSISCLHQLLVIPNLDEAAGESTELDLVIVGGCWSMKNDSICETSMRNVFGVLEMMHACPVKLHITTILVLDENMASPKPLCSGIAINTRTGEVFKAVFESESRGPCDTLRYARSMTDSELGLVPVYDRAKDAYVVLPFSWDRKAFTEDYYKIVEKMPDEKALESFSEAPECEGADFVRRNREALKILTFETPEKCFAEKKPLFFNEKGEKI